MLKLLYLIILIAIILVLIIHLNNSNLNIEKLTVTSSKSKSKSNDLCCKEESSITILLNNLNHKYDTVMDEYKVLQENITTNTERINTIYTKYESQNNKLQAELSS